MSWADIVQQECLDNSRDGLNLMIKSTLNVGKKLQENEKANALLSGHTASRSLLGSRRTTGPTKEKMPTIDEPIPDAESIDTHKPSPWKAALLKQKPVTDDKQQTTMKMDIDENSNMSIRSLPMSEVSNGFNKRKIEEMKTQAEGKLKDSLQSDEEKKNQ
mmetsp:Transcript_2164/g.3075  ORF Transcript_2164/g.3075 Transcript_2164/m.3075 type:complete len:160 (+) Transcript_2164:154-633(+)|eukprot:CAMPEP_0204841334 /NCGR_PEP_ID=MMETSP1346-20131115/41413_1 /ASSEMBLY_ACC=CAM_ASM_000771 /TAXON_ID=215587 /ORGANISM="Aplanochytrium stocchinoi, Strain GSBS06" /LENGTH=159 /DNA_ID=CAMNT_0051979369 /DNA_START=146 /DNA_END=628 /DNA_ORIENTATION=-